MQKQSERTLTLISNEAKQRNICGYSFDEFLELVRSFHGYQAPGVLLGGMMVEAAIQRLPENILYDAVSETTHCLPDAIQLLTPCTTGNGWLRVFNLGRYALSFYDKCEGDGVRVAVDPDALEAWPEIKTWLFKLKEKKDQDSPLLLKQIREAGLDIFKFQEVHILPKYLVKHPKAAIAVCSLCREPYPREHGRICRACKGETPYFSHPSSGDQPDITFPSVSKIPVEQAVGRKALHDMTQIVPGKSKGPVFKRGQMISVGDICRLGQMGRQSIYVDEESPGAEWIHEDKAALGFAREMAGSGVMFKEPPAEGKISFIASTDGLLTIDEERLERFNLAPGVMCATRKNHTVMTKGHEFAGTRAIPLYLHQSDYERAMAILSEGPLFQVRRMKKARVGILVTGTEVFTGVIQDKFIPVIQAKVKECGCKVVHTAIVPDEIEAMEKGISAILEAGAELMVTTAGLSVDPDDITRQGLIKAGAEDMRYGAPILPGAMTLLCRIGDVKVFGVPACALFFKTTSFDLLLPRILADIPITRNDLARMGHGAFCQQCKTCQYPKCAFGK